MWFRVATGVPVSARVSPSSKVSESRSESLCNKHLSSDGLRLRSHGPHFHQSTTNLCSKWSCHEAMLVLQTTKTRLLRPRTVSRSFLAVRRACEKWSLMADGSPWRSISLLRGFPPPRKFATLPKLPETCLTRTRHVLDFWFLSQGKLLARNRSTCCTKLINIELKSLQRLA